MSTGQCWLLLLFCASVGSTPIDNGLTADPSIICGSDRMMVLFGTRNPFRGNVYSKGHFVQPECRSQSPGESTNVSITIPVEGDCGLRRRRTVNPSGIVLEATVVIMFHPLAFRIECFYMETGKELTQQLHVSMISTTEIIQPTVQGAVTMPDCKYEVLKGGPDGAPVSYAIIGEPVYHKWTCDGPQAALYCMTVHSCAVDDGQGVTQPLLDANGCALDKFLLSNLEYAGPMVAGKEAHVFKFADRPTVFFNCQIRLELRESQPNCLRSSDTCTEPTGFAAPSSQPITETIEPDFPRPGPLPIGNETVSFSSDSTPVSSENNLNNNGTSVPTENNLESNGTSVATENNLSSNGSVGAPSLISDPTSNATANAAESGATSNATSASTENGATNNIATGEAVGDSAGNSSAIEEAAINNTLSLYFRRRYSREAAGFSVDVDVSAPAVDIIDIHESAEQRSDRLRLLELEPRAPVRNEVCLSRLSVGIYSATAVFLLLLVSSIVLTIFWQVAKGRLTWSNKALYLER